MPSATKARARVTAWPENVALDTQIYAHTSNGEVPVPRRDLNTTASFPTALRSGRKSNNRLVEFGSETTWITYL